MKENFTNLVKEIDMQVQDAQTVLNKLEHNEEINIQPEQKEEIRFFFNDDCIRSP